jgi:hypothetical protein
VNVITIERGSALVRLALAQAAAGPRAGAGASLRRLGTCPASPARPGRIGGCSAPTHPAGVARTLDDQRSYVETVSARDEFPWTFPSVHGAADELIARLRETAVKAREIAPAT